MKFLETAEIHELDQRMIRERGTSGVVLMNRAGLALSRAISLLGEIAQRRRTALLVAGKGNNGGDVFVTARHLHVSGWRVGVLLTSPPPLLRGDARLAWGEMDKAGVPQMVLAAERDWDDAVIYADGAAQIPQAAFVVDGLLGTGIGGQPVGTVAAAIRWINAMRGRALVVAADIPSGLDADSGAAAGEAVCADVTVTFAYPKTGFLNPCAQAKVGHLLVADIGIDADLCHAAEQKGRGAAAAFGRAHFSAIAATTP